MTHSDHMLAIEISNPGAGVRALAAGGVSGPSVALGRLSGSAIEVIGEESLRSQTSDTGRSGGHDDDLLPAIDRLCARLGVDRRTIGRVAASIGPGGYTSVRIAVAAAKMIALANGGSCVGVPTALGVWHGAPAALRSSPLAIVLASKGESFYMQRADGRGLLGSGGLATPEAIDGLADEGVRTIMADQHFPSAARARAAARGMQVVEPVFAARSVLQAAVTLEPVDPAALVPVYPREPEAVSLWKTRKA